MITDAFQNWKNFPIVIKICVCILNIVAEYLSIYGLEGIKKTKRIYMSQLWKHYLVHIILAQKLSAVSHKFSLCLISGFSVL